MIRNSRNTNFILDFAVPASLSPRLYEAGQTKAEKGISSELAGERAFLMDGLMAPRNSLPIKRAVVNSLESVRREELGYVDFFLVGAPEILAAECLSRGAPAAPRT